MGALSDLLGGTGFGGGGMVSLIISILIGVVAIGVIAGLVWYFFYRKKNWNLDVEFKFPRGLNNLKPTQTLELDEITGFVGAEWGKGMFDTKMGVVLLKRKGKKPVFMKPFDLKRFMQGNKILTVAQIGAVEYIPILPESFIGVQDEKGGQAILLKARTDATADRSWRTSIERESKATYSIRSLLAEYVPYIGTGIILIMNFIGFAILYNKIK